MKISYQWLKQFIHLDWKADETANLLTDLGLEVEGIETVDSIKGGLKGIVVGHVLSCNPHPNADRLKVTTVDIGQEAPLQIVCGAPNVATGQKVAVATIGTTLYDAEGKAWKIKKGKIRGENSMGMICAEDELGLGENHQGILVLDNSLDPGTQVAEIFNIETDTVFEIGLTPNRADAMSHFGVARDLRAGLMQKGLKVEIITPSNSNFRVDNRLNKVDVEVIDSNLAPRYCGLTISGIKVQDSPTWIKNRLKAIGLNPVNNVVDITNYVLHELGQPLHAFDLSKISGNKIEVKTLEAGTLFTTLDGIERELHQEDLMICDAEKPLCIAGIFGGMDSEVNQNTSSIFLESAYFNPISIRKTAKRFGLNTDASFRFERGIDPKITKYALMRAGQLIKEIAGGEITSDVVDVYPHKIDDFQVFVNFKNINRLIGEELPKETIKNILASLEIKVNNITESGLGLTIPSYRNDVQREADVIEEILRVYGYNNIKFSTKLKASISKINTVDDFKVQNTIASQLNALGFHEMMANSLTKPTYTDLCQDLNESHNVLIINHLSQDLSALRQSMLFSCLEVLAYNYNRKQSDIKLFEFGKTYHNYPNKRSENKHLALVVSGNTRPINWNVKNSSADFFYLKGLVVALLEKLGITETIEKPVSNDVFSEGISLSSGYQLMVEFGLVKTSILNHFDIDIEVFYADFNWDNILDIIKNNSIKLKDIPKYPEVKRDFSLLLNESVSFNEVYDIARKTEGKLLKSINLFDVYQGDNLPKGKKSYAVSFTLQDERKTLTDKQIDKIMTKLQQNFKKKLDAELR